VKVLRRYNFKLYPNKAQEAALVRQCQLTAWLWNAALHQLELDYCENRKKDTEGNHVVDYSVMNCRLMSLASKPLVEALARVQPTDGKAVSKYSQGRAIKYIRAENPEYAAMSSSSLQLVFDALQLAFQAFFRRAKSGAGKASGYPAYKSSCAESHRFHTTIWHRDGFGWKLSPRGKNFALYAKGIPGLMSARGRFPVKDMEIRDMRIMRANGEWFASIVVRMDAREASGSISAEIEFDLIDKFASVKNRANGRHFPGWEDGFFSSDEQITQANEGIIAEPASDALHLRGDSGNATQPHQGRLASDALHSGSIETPKRVPREQSTDDATSIADKRFKRFSWRWKEARRRVASRRSKEARRNRENLHMLTTNLVRRCSDIHVIAPKIKEATASARGNERDHGAAVKLVATLNRHVLAQAPAMAIAMLEYKAAEAGMQFTRTIPVEHKVAVGRDISKATKTGRIAARKLRKEAA
jgi:transposase